MPRCDDCVSSVRCRWLLGSSYNSEGPCDWSPSRFNSKPTPPVLMSGTVESRAALYAIGAPCSYASRCGRYCEMPHDPFNCGIRKVWSHEG